MPESAIVPRLVVIEHECHCDSATLLVFTVDGEPFPWPIDECGPVVTRLHDDWYAVWVKIPVLRDETVTIIDTDLVIGDKRFPWAITEEGFVFSVRRTFAPAIRLAFFARDVAAHGIKVHDVRNQDRAIMDNQGNRWPSG